MSEIDDALQLVRGAAALKEQSLEMNSAIDDLEEQLEALDIGVEVWVHVEAGTLQLGYVRLEKKWQLAVKDAEPPRPLRKATRLERVLASAVIDALIVELSQTVWGFASSTQGAAGRYRTATNNLRFAEKRSTEP